MTYDPREGQEVQSRVDEQNFIPAFADWQQIAKVDDGRLGALDEGPTTYNQSVIVPEQPIIWKRDGPTTQAHAATYSRKTIAALRFKL